MALLLIVPLLGVAAPAGANVTYSMDRNVHVLCLDLDRDSYGSREVAFPFASP